ncbi:MAG TPA: CBS domain-containing protein [Armatimonadota bacterium]|jgi:CBS domain-containing protein/anti-sigma regulatory factor (Ser/Thr protein kinase)|nr:CBS domain-containing protein [Armatimonadota bacterium]HPT99734.1 CBS domain-containing protein [Armatimonadota bacterium]
MSVINHTNGFSVAHELIYTLKVRDAMSRDVVTVTPDNSLREVQAILRERRISGTPVLEDGRLVGIVSLEDIISALDHGHIEERVGDWMTTNVVTIQDNMPLHRAVEYFRRYRFGRIPVLDAGGCLCGILTQADIVVRLMEELNHIAEEAARREIALLQRAGTPITQGQEVTMEFPVNAGDFDNAGIASARIKAALKERGIDIKVARRAAIATYEAETNIIIHSIGGAITARIGAESITIQAVDWGPGIEDVEMALRPGFSTASELVRVMGFGAGMGLPNIQKCADRFHIESKPGSGTRLEVEIDLHPLVSEGGE